MTSKSNATEDFDDDDEYYVPLVDQRVFGAGLKRKRIAFVPATSDGDSVRSVISSSNAGDHYLSIVLPQKGIDTPLPLDAATHVSRRNSDNEPLPQVGTPSNVAHDTSIANQLNAEHSHPPSHLDRTRLGIKYLQNFGWDPDAREGLGSRGEGIRIPVKANLKSDTTGLGLFADSEDGVGEQSKAKRSSSSTATATATAKLNAKQVRKIEENKRTKIEKLRKSIYGEDLSRYLGPEEQV